MSIMSSMINNIQIDDNKYSIENLIDEFNINNTSGVKHKLLYDFLNMLRIYSFERDAIFYFLDSFNTSDNVIVYKKCRSDKIIELTFIFNIKDLTTSNVNVNQKYLVDKINKSIEINSFFSFKELRINFAHENVILIKYCDDEEFRKFLYKTKNYYTNPVFYNVTDLIKLVWKRVF